jgi:O-acetyl-ADP-ribose deacetylase (regulator of RNase III)
MSEEIQVKRTKVRLLRDDITDLDIECFVFHARPDLKLGSGFGTAISVRGGPSIQDELNQVGPRKVTEVVTSSAGELKADWIIHAVAPTFQEPDTGGKLSTTVLNVLEEADRRKFKRLAFPALGVGFYGIPLDVCADIMISTITEYLEQTSSGLDEIILCMLDNRELIPFQQRLGRAALV